jgi:hypothetical protein
VTAVPRRPKVDPDPHYKSIKISRALGRLAEVHNERKDAARITCLVRVLGPPEQTADENLAKLLELYAKDANVQLLCIEDATGPLHSVNDLPVTPVLRRAVAGFAGWRTGVDDLRSRDAMLEVQRLATTRHSEIDRVISSLAKHLDALIQSDENPVRRDLFQLRAQWWNSHPLGSLSARLLAIARSRGVNLDRRDRIVLRAHEMSEEIDFNEVQLEKQEVVARIQQTAKTPIRSPYIATAKGAAVEGWLSSTAPTPETAIDVTRLHSQGAFERREGNGLNPNLWLATLAGQQLLELCRVLVIDLAPYPNFVRYVEQLQLFECLPVGEAEAPRTHVAVIEGALAQVEAAVFDSTEIRAIADSQRALHRLASLARLQLTPDGVREVVGNLEAHGLSAIVAVLRKQGAHVPTSVASHALRRATTMATNTIRELRERKLEHAVLISLGFHVDTITKVIAAEGLRCVVVYPHFDL